MTEEEKRRVAAANGLMTLRTDTPEEQAIIDRAVRALRGEPEPMSEVEAKDIIITQLNILLPGWRKAGMEADATRLEEAANIMDNAWRTNR